ncbi:MAG: diguanylate cyclase, partial [Gammaproteobacteria bacterium]|nr:diguanylate cyclase [Gammaproteobacteria bacterium]
MPLLRTKKYIMGIKKFHSYLHQQILIMLGLSLISGLGYIFLGWLNDIVLPALIWYGLLVVCCIWGYTIYRAFSFDGMSHAQLNSWYKNLTWFFYLIFFLWTVIFILYAGETASKLHYIAIFTQISISVVASAVLFPDKKLYLPNITILMVPLIIYFAGIQEWYGYILGLFAFVFMFILLYAAESSNKLLLQTDYQASHDQLTGLYNRNHFINFLQQTFNTLKANKQYSYLLLIDLDHFKTINDSLGHDIGDQLLLAVAERMKAHISKQHTLARLGGDEFIIIGPEFNTQKDCRESALLFSEQ